MTTPDDAHGSSLIRSLREVALYPPHPPRKPTAPSPEEAAQLSNVPQVTGRVSAGVKHEG